MSGLSGRIQKLWGCLRVGHAIILQLSVKDARSLTVSNYPLVAERRLGEGLAK